MLLGRRGQSIFERLDGGFGPSDKIDLVPRETSGHDGSAPTRPEERGFRLETKGPEPLADAVPRSYGVRVNA